MSRAVHTICLLSQARGDGQIKRNLAGQRCLQELWRRQIETGDSVFFSRRLVYGSFAAVLGFMKDTAAERFVLETKTFT